MTNYITTLNGKRAFHVDHKSLAILICRHFGIKLGNWRFVSLDDKDITGHKFGVVEVAPGRGRYIEAEGDDKI
jgi:hypothetical protein